MRKRAKLVSGQFIVLLGFSFSPLKRNSNERTSGKSQKTEAHPAHSMCVCVFVFEAFPESAEKVFV
jgi:hypothetical protein